MTGDNGLAGKGPTGKAHLPGILALLTFSPLPIFAMGIRLAPGVTWSGAADVGRSLGRFPLCLWLTCAEKEGRH